MTTKETVAEAAKAVRYILDTDTPDHDNRKLEVRIAQAVIDCLHPAPDKEPVAWINVEERTLEWNGPVEWLTPTVIKLMKIPLYTHPAPDLAKKDAELERLNAAVAEYKAMWNKEATDHLTTYALVAAAYRAAADEVARLADVCRKANHGETADELCFARDKIADLTPADATNKLRELMMEVANRTDGAWVNMSLPTAQCPTWKELEALVDEVLGK